MTFVSMRRSRLLLLLLLPTYGLLSIPLISVVPYAATVLAMSNIVTITMLFMISFLHADGLITGMLFVFLFPTALVVFNLAFWLPAAHLTDVMLERARRRRRLSQGRADPPAGQS